MFTRPTTTRRLFTALLTVAIAIPVAGQATARTTLAAAHCTAGTCSHVVAAPTRLLLALGDSVAAGHHDNICDDPNYPPYNRAAFNSIVAAAPSTEHWVYANYAHSGFTTGQVIAGGTNACGATFPAPLQAAVTLLGNPLYHGNRNIVVISAGINNTNWVQVLKQAILQSPPDCTPIAAGWDGKTQAPKISADAHTIATALTKADPSVTIIWTGYFSMAGSFPMPSYCNALLNTDINVVFSAFSSGLSGVTQAHAVNVEQDFPPATRSQTIQPLNLFANPYGWPHPSVVGHQAMGATVYSALQKLGVVK